MQSLFGITRPSAGTAEIDGAPVQIKSPADAVENELVYVTEVLGLSDRVIVRREGLMVAELDGDDLQPEPLVRHAAGF